jgi:halimadienyl-diphosphate synthase
MNDGRALRADLLFLARQLLTSLGEGEMSECAYDTAWVARIPNPSNPAEPLFPASYDWLLQNQLADGSWGAEIPFAYDRVVSTVAVLLALTDTEYRRQESEIAARRAIVYLNTAQLRLRDDPVETVGFELILPELLRQAQLAGLSLPYADWSFVETIKANKLSRIPPIAIYGGPTTLSHSLEYLGDRLAASLVQRTRIGNGSYGASPSATAYVHMRVPDDETLAYLRSVPNVSSTGGVVDVYPINVFETAWVLQSLAPLRSELPEFEDGVRLLSSYWTPGGVSFTDAGMVSDADDSAVTVAVLQTNGLESHPEVFDLFEGDEYFFCFPFERNQSIRANAGVLEAIKLYDSTPDRRRMLLKLVHFLQRSATGDLYWIDKWHASPFYATSRVVTSLSGLDNLSVRRAVQWVIDQQHENGSWGFEDGTAEETAYAIEALISGQEAEPALASVNRPIIEQGVASLLEQLFVPERPALWAGKGMYLPRKVVEAAIVGALARATTVLAGTAR